VNRHAVTVRRSGRKDRYGDPIDAIEFTVPGCILAPRASTEVQSYSDTVLSEYTLLAPPTADIRATDELLIDGDRYAVEGDPQQWDSPFTTWRPGMQVALRRVRG
jgi:hypothetical protein